MDSVTMPPPGLRPSDLMMANAINQQATPHGTMSKSTARKTAEDFEAVFLNSMFQQMYTGIDGDGPFGGKGAAGVWRSFLTQSFAKSFAHAGGVGIANDVYKTLLSHQENAQ
ncbi:MAG: flagellar assembly peptidoglycan hydrolase FlgJ [Pseudolabrys sp.]|jgi:peptidoglycan hydrolase FlgJ